MRVRDVTEKLRRERDEIDQPLQRMQALVKNIKMQIEGKKSEIDMIKSRREKIAGEFE